MTGQTGIDAAGLDPPRFENGRPMVIAGLRGHFTYANWEGIPAQWQRLGAYGNVPGKVGSAHYGLCFQMSSGIDYLCGIEVSGVAGLPGDFSHAAIPAQRYAIFPYREHVSKLRNTLDIIWRKWFPSSGHQPVQPSVDAPAFFERYGEKFDPVAGMGDVEVWIPVQP